MIPLRGQWIVHERRHPFGYDGRHHVEYNIVTAYDHPQAKAPIMIVGGSRGLGYKDGPPIDMVAISIEDVEFIATMNPATIKLMIDDINVLKHALEYYADPENHKPDSRIDPGQVARIALENHKHFFPEK